MDRDFVISIIKFMNQMGMKTSVDITRSYMNPNGRKSVCVEVIVEHKRKKEYDSYHCYELRNDKIVYSEGNEVIAVKEGLLAYLGNNRDVENYLEGLARYEAKKFFEKSF